jgi:RNA polymerase sigma-70 factor, ECF subfamily
MGSAALSDDEVVAQVLGGQVGLFEILMRRYNQRVFRVVRGILGDDAEAEDVTQEAYVKAFHALAGFRGEPRRWGSPRRMRGCACTVPRLPCGGI